MARFHIAMISGKSEFILETNARHSYTKSCYIPKHIGGREILFNGKPGQSNKTAFIDRDLPSLFLDCKLIRWRLRLANGRDYSESCRG